MAPRRIRVRPFVGGGLSALADAGPQPIFVGDVQGCADELEVLVERAHDRFGDEFQLQIVGDLINRGPANIRALELVRGLVDAGRCAYVLGNHEIGFLRVALGLGPIKERDTFGEVLADRDAKDWVEWIRRRPLMSCGEIGGYAYVMVHAALHPTARLDDQTAHARAVEARLAAHDVAEVRELLASDGSGPVAGDDRDWLGRFTRCRSVDGDRWSSATPAGRFEAWHAAWSREAPDYGVVYGHWALQGLHVAAGLRGLDTGCVHHGRGRDGHLTAWLPPASGRGAALFALPDEAFWHIPARRRYYPY